MRINRKRGAKPMGKFRKADGNLSRVHAQVMDLEHLEDYDGDLESSQLSFEDLEDWEKENWEREFLEDMENYGEHVARRNVTRRYKGRGRAFLKGYAKNNPTALTGGNGGFKATVTLVVTRLTNNLPVSLPVQLFNLIDNYANDQILRRYVPAGYVLFSSNTDASRTNWEFIYQAAGGGATDRIVISCVELSFNKLQLATQTDLFRVARTQYKISDENQQQQFNQQFTIVSQSMFGKGKENPLTVPSFIDPKDYRKDTVRIPIQYDIDKQTGIILGMCYIAGGSNFSVSLPLSISVFSQWTSGSRRG